MDIHGLTHSIREFVKENFLFGTEEAFSNEDSLVKSGIIDSTGVLELVAHVESTYAIAIDDRELIPQNLDSITNLTRFIMAKLGTVNT